METILILGAARGTFGIPCAGIHIYTPGPHLSTQGNKTKNLTFGEYQLYHPTQIFNVNSDNNQNSTLKTGRAGADI
jgi:hypothetical protein